MIPFDINLVVGQNYKSKYQQFNLQFNPQNIRKHFVIQILKVDTVMIYLCKINVILK